MDYDIDEEINKSDEWRKQLILTGIFPNKHDLDYFYKCTKEMSNKRKEEYLNYLQNTAGYKASEIISKSGEIIEGLLKKI